jgi:hypothetical protein
MVLADYVQLTPRTGKFTPERAAERARFQKTLLATSAAE